jgi:methionyl-tRNA formyltransferase
VVIAFGQKISNEVIALAKKGALNVHASLLPKYRGAAPINWAIINGEEQTGVSIITLAERMDAGDILAQQAIEIKPDETAGELHERLCHTAAPLLAKTLDAIEAGTAVYTKQDEVKVTHAPKLTKSDGFHDFSRPADVVRRRILGLWPWPGASALYLAKKTGRQSRVTIARATASDSKVPNLPPGTFDEQLNVACGAGLIRIVEIQPEGGRLMGFADFVNGRATRPGDMLLKIEK